MTQDGDATIACADLCARIGATSFEVGCLDDDVPVEQARWYAHAQFRGSRVTVEDKRSPDEAADALAERLLRGGRCTLCDRIVTLVVVHETRCTWWRDGSAWVRGCDGKRQATRKDES